MRNIAILLASGSGTRMGTNIPKQFIELGQKYLFEYSLRTLNNHINIDEIVIVSRVDYIELVKNVIKKANYHKVVRVIAGGESRQESVSNGIFSIVHEEGNVLIHDAARPFVTNKMIDEIIDALKIYNAVSTVIPSSDTIFEVDEIGIVINIPERSSMVRVQTPQGFDLSTIRKAHYLAQKHNLSQSTDDCSLIAYYNLGQIYTVEGCEIAFKVTTKQDLEFAKLIINNSTRVNTD